jgi:ZIP family zinc transporter
MELSDFVQPFLLSLLAGSASGIGGLIVLRFGKIRDSLMGFLMGFAGGVMLIVSFLDLFMEALELMSPMYATFGFAVGAIIMMGIDLTVPHIEGGQWEPGIADPKLIKTGVIIALGISIHNLPEGIVVSAGYTHAPDLGLLLAIIICLHNIPEGIAMAAPLVAGGMSKKRAALMALFSGMTEPIGALIGAFALMYFGENGTVIGMGLALAAGVMTYITVDELIPVAHEYCSVTHKHYISTGLLTGMIFGQVLSLLLHP